MLAGQSHSQIRLRWRLLIYLGIWLIVASVIALGAEFYIPEADDPPIYVSRIYLFLAAPFWVSVGLDAAITRSPGLLCWLILVAFVSHALFSFSCTQRRSFAILTTLLVVAVAIGTFYILRVIHDNVIHGHG